MSIALYAMFIGLLVPSMKGNRKVVMLAGSGGSHPLYPVLHGGIVNGLVDS